MVCFTTVDRWSPTVYLCDQVWASHLLIQTPVHCPIHSSVLTPGTADVPKPRGRKSVTTERGLGIRFHLGQENIPWALIVVFKSNFLVSPTDDGQLWWIHRWSVYIVYDPFEVFCNSYLIHMCISLGLVALTRLLQRSNGGMGASSVYYLFITMLLPILSRLVSCVVN